MRPTCLNPEYQKNIELAYDYQTHSCLHLLKNKPQINADERRFVNLNIQHSPEVYQKNSLTVRILRFPIIFWFENHTELRGHREKWQPSVFSVYSVVNCPILTKDGSMEVDHETL
jgi:hypothetical protein